MAISDDDGYFVCDYCGDDTGKFNAETGNHESCEELAKLRVELSALRRVAEAARAMLSPKEVSVEEYEDICNEAESALAEYDKCRAA